MRNKLLFLLICLLLMATGCKGEPALGSRGVIYAFVGNTDQTHWQQLAWGLEAFGQEEGLDIRVIELDIEGQERASLKQIKGAIKKSTGAIIIRPFDSDRLEGLLKSAHKKAIPLIYLEDRPSGQEPPGTLIYTDREKAAKEAGKAMVELLEGSGEIAIIGTNNAGDLEDPRETGFIDGIKGHQNVKLVNIYDCRGDSHIAKQTAIDILSAYPSLGGLYATCPQAAIGAAEALAELGINSRVKVLSFGYNDELLTYINNNRVCGAVTENSYQAGYLAGQAALSLMKGESIGKDIEAGFNFISGESDK